MLDAATAAARHGGTHEVRQARDLERHSLPLARGHARHGRTDQKAQDEENAQHGAQSARLSARCKVATPGAPCDFVRESQEVETSN